MLKDVKGKMGNSCNILILIASSFALISDGPQLLKPEVPKKLSQLSSSQSSNESIENEELVLSVEPFPYLRRL